MRLIVGNLRLVPLRVSDQSITVHLVTVIRLDHLILLLRAHHIVIQCRPVGAARARTHRSMVGDFGSLLDLLTDIALQVLEVLVRGWVTVVPALTQVHRIREVARTFGA